MDKLARYRQLIKENLREIASHKPSYGDVEIETIFDEQGDHYELMPVGWNGQKRIYGCLLHVDLKDGKIWIQYDGVEGGLANRLVEAGVPKSEIVLGFHSPFKRKFTEFAVG